MFCFCFAIFITQSKKEDKRNTHLSVFMSMIKKKKMQAARLSTCNVYQKTFYPKTRRTEKNSFLFVCEALIDCMFSQRERNRMREMKPDELYYLFIIMCFSCKMLK